MKDCCDNQSEQAILNRDSLNIATIGNPNSGKTTLFNALTGARQRVGNFSGVTVEKASGQFTASDKQINLVDLPGVYSLESMGDKGALDEKVARDYLEQHQLDLVINVVDASSLERGLFLSLQLKELGLPVLLVVNKMDTDKAKQLDINTTALSEALKMPVIALSATHKGDVEKLKRKLIAQTALAQQAGQPAVSYPDAINQFFLGAEAIGLSRRDAFDLLNDEQPACVNGDSALNEQAQRLRTNIGNYDIELGLAEARYSRIYEITQFAVKAKGQLSQDVSERLDKVLLNKWLGIPAFLLSMYAMFMFAIHGGAVFIDFFDITFGTVFVDGVAQLLEALSAPGWLVMILSEGIGAGIQTVATFIPVIAFLYLFLAVLESSGYLARAAFVVDRFMQKIGLPGKAFVPMLMGFGCTVPAVMATRVLEKERERILTSAMSPFMSCGARLPVYALFVAAFFPHNGQNVVFVLYLLGILAAVVTGLLLKHTLLPGSAQENLLELPDYQIPRVSNILLLTWQKVRGFIMGAGKTIVVVVAILSVLNSITLKGKATDPGSDDAILAQASQLVTPVFAPMGVEENNWQATVGIVTGLFAKEAVIGTLNTLYSDAGEDEAWSYGERFAEAFATIPDNLFGMSFSDPLGIAVEEGLSEQEAADELEIDLTTMNMLQQHFTSASAVAYMLFILLYMPCAAAMGAIVKELGSAWARLIAVWSTLLAYCSATGYYQVMNFSHAPLKSSLTLLGVALAVAVFIIALKRMGRRNYDLAAA